MPTFIAQGRYSRDAVRGMTETPEDRTVPVGRMIEQLGGKLVHFYMTTGENDWLIVVEAPDQDTAVAASLVAAGTGGAGDIKTSRAYTGAEAKALFERARDVARGFQPAGHANRKAAAA